MPTEAADGTMPGDPALALVVTRLAELATAVTALSDAVDALPTEQAGRLRPLVAAAYGALIECEEVATDLAVEH